MDEIGPETVISRARNVISREIQGKLVLLTPANGTIHELDDVGSYIWFLCGKPVSIKSVVQNIVEEYDVETHVAEEDAMSFIADMIKQGTISRA